MNTLFVISIALCSAWYTVEKAINYERTIKEQGWMGGKEKMVSGYCII